MSWTWINENYRAQLPADLAASVMDTREPRPLSRQARALDGAGGPARERSARCRLSEAAFSPALARAAGRAARSRRAGTRPPRPSGRISSARAALGIDVPEVVAAGEQSARAPALQSFLMIAELTGSTAVNELLPQLADRLDRAELCRLKRRVIAEMARITATLHRARVFHKDLYLCHFFLEPRQAHSGLSSEGLSLIDLHRLRNTGSCPTGGAGRIWPSCSFRRKGRRHHGAGSCAVLESLLPAAPGSSGLGWHARWSGQSGPLPGA